MKHFLLAIILFSAVRSLAQTDVYHPFLHEGAEWGILSMDWLDGIGDTSYGYYSNCSDGDTLIADKTYIKVRYAVDGECAYSPKGWFRQDTIEKRVYLNGDGHLFDGDTLLYDFSVSPGQSVSHCATFALFDSAYVTRIDSVEVGGSYRKKFVIHFYTDGIVDSTYWIEGIGGVFGPIPTGLSVGDFGYGNYEFISTAIHLICYREHGDILYEAPYYIFNCEVTHDIADAYHGDLVSIYPVPASTLLHINILQNTNEMYYCEMLTLEGILKESFEFRTSHIVDVTGYNPGVYVLAVFRNGVMREGKILIVL